MFITKNIEAYQNLKNKSRYDKGSADALKLTAFTLKKEIEKEEENNFEVIRDKMAELNVPYFTVLPCGFHCEKSLDKHTFNDIQFCGKAWRAPHYAITTKEAFWGIRLFQDKSEYRGLYVKLDNQYIQVKKRKDILNFYFNMNIGTTCSSIPLPSHHFTSTTASDILGCIENIKRFSTTDIILANLKVIRRYIKEFHWNGKEEVIERIKPYAHIR
jgi:hypothetical protein